MLFAIVFIIALFSLAYAIMSAIKEYEQPLPSWYGVTSSFWTTFWKIIHAIARFIWVIFWGIWTIIILCLAFGGTGKTPDILKDINK